MAVKLTRGSYALPGTALSYHTGTWRTQRPQYRHQLAPCHIACPAGEDPQAWIAFLDEGKPEKAWHALVSANPLPAITGRVCPHPCEGQCNRQYYDEAVAIHSLERYLGDQALAEGWDYPLAPATKSVTGRVAVIGAGPSGLTAAWHLHRHGVAVELFEMAPEAGGTLFTIPGYRLPKDIVRSEIARLLATGIAFFPNKQLGRDLDLHELLNEYDAVYLAPGLMQNREWSIDGVTPRDLHDGLKLLREWMDVGEIPRMQRAAVVGGGNTAIDVARVLNKHGVETHIVIHSSLPGANADPADVMRAIPREIEQALEEGVTIHDHHGIKRLILRGEKVTGIEITRMKKLADSSGRLNRVAFEGTESVIHVDQVIPAIGQQIDPHGMESVLEGAGSLRVDTNSLVVGQARIYAGGDAIEGNHGTVTEAVGNGRLAAMSILASLKKEANPHSDTRPTPIAFDSLNLAYFEPSPAQQQTLLPVTERLGETEIEMGFNHPHASYEARRCLSCGGCLSCDNCWTLCPDSAVLKTEDANDAGSHYQIDYDYCKGCGLCAHECPCGHIEMVEEV